MSLNDDTRYRTKPRYCNAVLADPGHGNPHAAVPAWLVDAFMSGDIIRESDGKWRAGDAVISPGDWLVRWDDGTIEVFTDEQFHRTFDSVPQYAEEDRA